MFMSRDDIVKSAVDVLDHGERILIAMHAASGSIKYEAIEEMAVERALELGWEMPDTIDT